jgi:hypothetical protein
VALPTQKIIERLAGQQAQQMKNTENSFTLVFIGKHQKSTSVKNSEPDWVKDILRCPKNAIRYKL